MLTEIELQGFRCLQDGSFSVPRGRTLVLGDNGAGKSSLLEALYLALTIRSFRTSQIKDCCRDPAQGFSVSAEIDDEGRSRLETGWVGGRRWHRLNHSKSSAVDHVKVKGVLVWSGERGDSFGLQPEHRRVLLDRGLLVEDPLVLPLWRRFGKILRQKREILIRGDRSQLPAWNKLFAEAGALQISRRRDYASRLEQALDEIVDRVGLRWPEPRISYSSSPREGEQGEGPLLEALERMELEEVRRGRCLAGPQLDDVQLLWGGKEMRRVASQGERKSSGLAILAAQGELARRRHREPIILLDDCDAELDQERLRRLWRAFDGASQILATSNREEAWRATDMDGIQKLDNGRLRGR